MEKRKIEPEQVIEEIFDVVREWAKKPENAHHLMTVMGMTVEYPKAEPKLVNPHVLVKTRSEEEFHQIFANMTLAQLKSVLVNNKLGTKTEFTGKKKPELLDTLYARALAKAEETNIR